MPKSISALITIVSLIGLLVGLVFLFVPLITRQAQMISRINVDEVVKYFAGVIDRLQGLAAFL